MQCFPSFEHALVFYKRASKLTKTNNTKISDGIRKCEKTIKRKLGKYFAKQFNVETKKKHL